MDILLVDGYNMIGASQQLKDLKANSFEEARDVLIQKMAEYQSYTGNRVIVVFDAHLVKGLEKKQTNHRVEVIFTKENETADERIEKLAQALNNIATQIHVATSDYTEQWAIFGRGHCGNQRELLREVETIERRIERRVRKITSEKPAGKIALSEEVLKTFEKWRRGDLD